MQESFYKGDRYGRERCDAGDFPRHRHAFGYICVILSGRFIEAGDAGRFRAGPGDALIHRPFEAHLDLFGLNSADVLNLPMIDPLPEAGLIRIEDPDMIARIAERDPFAASEAVTACLSQHRGEEDWPDLLAADLRSGRDSSIGDWAREHGLAPATVSRGFRLAYGTSPARYRAEARGRRAWHALANSSRPLAEVAFELGFADQPHMTRALTAITGLPPGKWRRQGQLGSRPA